MALDRARIASTDACTLSSRSFANSSEFRTGTNQILDLIRAHKAAALISDNRRLEGVSDLDQLWLQDSWHPWLSGRASSASGSWWRLAAWEVRDRSDRRQVWEDLIRDVHVRIGGRCRVVGSPSLDAHSPGLVPPRGPNGLIPRGYPWSRRKRRGRPGGDKAQVARDRLVPSTMKDSAPASSTAAAQPKMAQRPSALSACSVPARERPATT